MCRDVNSYICMVTSPQSTIFFQHNKNKETYHQAPEIYKMALTLLIISLRINAFNDNKLTCLFFIVQTSVRIACVYLQERSICRPTIVFYQGMVFKCKKMTGTIHSHKKAINLNTEIYKTKHFSNEKKFCSFKRYKIVNDRLIYTVQKTYVISVTSCVKKYYRNSSLFK